MKISEKISGKIIKIIANFYYVQNIKLGITWECFARARLLKEGKYLLVGDLVEIECTSAVQGVIVDSYDRRNKINKPPIANLDQALIVFSTKNPDFDFYNLDRYLSFVRYELQKEEIAICINKTDLKEMNIDEIYKNSAYKIFYVSALNKSGLDDLGKWLKNNTTVLTGPSGVGKSSLIKALSPESDILIGDLNAISRGKHITRNVQLIPVKIGDDAFGLLADTPGFSQISFAGLEPYKILSTFSEFNNTNCDYSNCLHNGEEGCVFNEADSSTRLESYRKILSEVTSEIKYGRKEESKAKSVGETSRGKGKYLPKIDRKSRAKSRRNEKQKLDYDEEFENQN